MLALYSNWEGMQTLTWWAVFGFGSQESFRVDKRLGIARLVGERQKRSPWLYRGCLPFVAGRVGDSPATSQRKRMKVYTMNQTESTRETYRAGGQGSFFGRYRSNEGHRPYARVVSQGCPQNRGAVFTFLRRSSHPEMGFGKACLVADRLKRLCRR